MNVNYQDVDGKTFAVIRSSEKLLKDEESCMDILGLVYYDASDALVLYAKEVVSNFWDLKNRLAGNILQKFSTYQQKLILVGDFSNLESKSLRDFIRESNKQGKVVFVESLQEGAKLLK